MVNFRYLRHALLELDLEHAALHRNRGDGAVEVVAEVVDGGVLHVRQRVFHNVQHSLRKLRARPGASPIAVGPAQTQSSPRRPR